ncbi:bifunctional sugar-1-phosphate nucleotidylyltransferase/acetyltransferase [Salinibaculum rarum]|uniref:bifunctional sugar-1-phosphate nucleotidylyltransferase/acetyltransferase n=1 Tax=Salinibaculum rarum TaxID=3058903 RepID=UPI00265DEB82|nr:bifunctional sugar-1-phosphate nucleotidylyltransferase/acetyltransferase [Salinibaculum sp. KK48]
MSVQTAVVLAAGEGTRLRPLTRNRPKPMLPAANRPILEHVLDALVDAGIERIVLVVGYRRERVQEHFGPSYRSVPIDYVVQRKQLGSGHALLQARETVDSAHLVVNGDRIIEAAAVESVVDAFENDTAPAALAVLERPDASRYGAVTLHDRDIDEIVEKPDSDTYRLINGGIYAFEPTIFDAINETEREAGELALTDTIAGLIDEKRVRGVRIGGLWVDATYPWDLLQVASEVLARGRISEPQRRESIWVDADASVHDDATLRGPVVVGPDCEVAPGAVIGPNVALGRNVTIGPNVTAERTVLDSDARVDAGSTLRDAVIGQDVHLGVSTTIPGGPSDVRVNQTVFEDQRLGAVLGDRTRARGDVSVEPGTLVGPNVTLGTGAHVRGTIPEGSEVFR